jgi:hypothetical protein
VEKLTATEKEEWDKAKAEAAVAAKSGCSFPIFIGEL